MCHGDVRIAETAVLFGLYDILQLQAAFAVIDHGSAVNCIYILRRIDVEFRRTAVRGDLLDLGIFRAGSVEGDFVSGLPDGTVISIQSRFSRRFEISSKMARDSLPPCLLRVDIL